MRWLYKERYHKLFKYSERVEILSNKMVKDLKMILYTLTVHEALSITVQLFSTYTNSKRQNAKIPQTIQGSSIQ